MQVEPAGHFVASQGCRSRPIGNFYTLGLQVVLPHHLLHVQPEVLQRLFALCLRQFQLRPGHPHLSPSAPPVENRQRQRQADVLLLHRSRVSLV